MQDDSEMVNAWRRKLVSYLFVIHQTCSVHSWATCRLLTMDHLWNLSHTAGILVSSHIVMLSGLYIPAPVRILIDSDHHSAGRHIVRQGWFTSWRRSRKRWCRDKPEDNEQKRLQGRAEARKLLCGYLRCEGILHHTRLRSLSTQPCENVEDCETSQCRFI